MSEYYLKKELYELFSKDPKILDFIEEGSLDGMWYWDLEHPEHGWMSQNFWKTFGYDPKKMKDPIPTWQDMIFKEDYDLVFEGTQKHLQDPKIPYSQLIRYKHRNGSTVWIRCRGIAIRDESGKPIRLLGAHNDVTDLMNTQIELENSYQKVEKLNKELEIKLKKETEKHSHYKADYETLFDAVPEAIFIHHIDPLSAVPSCFLDVNRSACVMTGMTKEKLLTLTPLDFRVEKNKEENVLEIAKEILKEGFSEEEERIIFPDGKELYILRSSVLRKERGEFIVYTTIKDITNQKLLEKKQREKEAIIVQQSRYAALGEMMGNIAHQWRQPLNTISLLWNKLLLHYENGSLDQKIMEKSAKKIERVTTEMSETIDSFRNFFIPNEEKKLFDLNDTVGKTFSIVKESLKGNKIEFIVKTNGELPVLGYENEFSQVLLSLIKNSKDAFLENKISSAFIEVIAKKEKNRAVITVSDNGGGIPEEVLKKIYDPYFTTKEEGKGIGEGLYMSKTIIEGSMGGKLYEKNTNRGVCFTIELPIQEKVRLGE